MAKQEYVERAVPIPEGVRVDIRGKVVEVSGPLGKLAKDFAHMPVDIAIRDSSVVVSARWPRKRELGMVGTAAGHVRNMIKGVTKGFTYKLKIVYAHFPMSVKFSKQEGKVLIENFCGEKTPRVAKVVEGAEVLVSGDDVIVKGIDLEAVSQTAANIEAATKIKDKDLRVFLDGIYLYEKSEGM
jgi:large subunit ribosomal protein L6